MAKWYTRYHQSRKIVLLTSRLQQIKIQFPSFSGLLVKHHRPTDTESEPLSSYRCLFSAAMNSSKRRIAKAFKIHRFYGAVAEWWTAKWDLFYTELTLALNSLSIEKRPLDPDNSPGRRTLHSACQGRSRFRDGIHGRRRKTPASILEPPIDETPPRPPLKTRGEQTSKRKEENRDKTGMTQEGQRGKRRIGRNREREK